MSARWSQALLIGSVLLLGGTLVVQSVPPMLAVPPGSQVSCAAPVWDAGKIFSGQTCSHDFVIRNSGRTAVTVKSVTASCGCTTFSKALAGRKVEAGDTVIVPVTWKIASQPGRQQKDVAVHFHEWPKWSLPLKVAGEVKASYTLSSPQLSLGTISSETESAQAVTIVFAEGSPAGRVMSAQCSHPGLSVSVKETENPREQQIVVTTRPPLPTGRLGTSIYVKLGEGSLVIPVLAAVKSQDGAAAELTSDTAVD